MPASLARLMSPRTPLRKCRSNGIKDGKRLTKPSPPRGPMTEVKKELLFVEESAPAPSAAPAKAAPKAPAASAASRKRPGDDGQTKPPAQKPAKKRRVIADDDDEDDDDAVLREKGDK
jgi:hypothetical protein